MATCKAWKPLFESFLWRIVELKSHYPAPQALVHNRHRIRSLSVAANDYVNLQTLAYDLPDITSFRGPGYLSPVTPEPLQEPDNLSKSSTARSNTFRSLRVIRFDYNSYKYAHDWKRPLCLSYILRIINQSPGLVQLALPESILSFSCDHAEPFMYTGAQELNIRGGNVSVETGLEFLRVCLNHPQLAKLHCDFRMEGLNDYFSIEDYELFDTFFTTVENDRKVKETAGKPVLGSPIKSLILPKTNEGYPPDFICMLLKSYLPNLERLHIPDISDRDESFTRSLEEAVVQGCPNLQHLRFSWYEEDIYIEEVINGIVKGCKQRGLKSFYCEDMHDDRGVILETLLDNHYNTLEEVELVKCRYVDSKNIGELLLCKDLKRVRIQQSTSDGAAIEFQHVEFRCRDLKELQLTLHRPDIDPLDDPFGSDDEEEDEEEDEDRVYERFSSWEERKAKEAYAQIGSLSKLESLSLNGDTVVNGPKGQSHNNDLTLHQGWLRQLAGLKELKYFHMATDFWYEMGQAEVEFMDTQWPKLKTIAFRCSDLNAIIEKPHWQWLRKRRPRLWGNTSGRQKKSFGLEYALRILKQSPGLLKLVAPEIILGENESVPSEHTESFLYTLAHKLPCIKELDIRGEGVPPKTGLDFLRVCLNHPQLANLHCNFGIVGQRDRFSVKDLHQFDAFLFSMDDDKKAKEATGMPALGSTIKSLILPKTHDGYPPNFICALLRSYLPNLERLHVPKIHVNSYASLKDSLKEVIAQGCPKLQHLRCSRYECDRTIVNGIVEGCQQWGLKSFYYEDLDDQYDRSILRTLSLHHWKTLEDVELTNCHGVESDSLVKIFSCRNLKRVKIQQSDTGSVAMKLQDVRFGCRDLKELQLTLLMPYFDLDSDEEVDPSDYFERCLARFEDCLQDWAEDAYTQIGSLSKLETLSLDYNDRQMLLDFDYDLTLKRGWLRQLAGLKELKHFHMAADFWSRMSQAEVEFMDEHWPKLERIVFSCEDLEDIVERPQWQWLQKRRPLLRYLQY
ncbi:MAG: hypothetical protein J3Q66DRAFT_424641 [Benniella sp.]|nr:MAG: hypothetical protein J3Q66DRAFT_424641 [Benniella sp.]